MKRYFFVFVSLFVVLILIYGNSFDCSFHFDDTPNIVTNSNVHPEALSWDELKSSFYGARAEQERIKRPLSYLSLALNYYFSGEEVFSYHVVNLTIHFITAVFLFLLVYNTLQLPLLKGRFENAAYAIALLSVFLWATHPVQLTAVTYIVQRMAAMAGMFYVIAMYLYLKGRTSRKSGKQAVFFFLCALSALLAFSSKENAAMLPVTLFLFDLFLIKGVSKENIKRYAKFAAIPVLIIAVLGVAYVDVGSFFKGYENRPFSLYERLLTEPRVIIFYISLLLYPVESRLTLIHDIDVSRSLLDPWSTALCILLICVIIAAALYVSKRRPLISFCVVFFFLNHLIEGSVFPLELIFEHRNYIPSMFFFVPIALVMIWVLDYFSYKPSIQFVMAFAFSFLIAAQAHTTYKRNETWKNNLTLWWDNAQKSPGLSRVHTNLGRAYDELGMKKRAVKCFRKALGVKKVMRKSGQSILYHNAGLGAFYEGNDDLAMRRFKKALEIKPTRENTLMLIIQLLLKRGELEKAHYELKNRVKDINEIRSAPLLKTYALVMYHDGRMDEAIDLSKKALQREPDHLDAVQILAQSFRAQGDMGKAKRYWREYLRKSPHSIEAHLALIEIYGEMKETKGLDALISRLFFLSRGKDLCSLVKNRTRKTNLLYVYFPDLESIRRITERALVQRSEGFWDCETEQAPGR